MTASRRALIAGLAVVSVVALAFGVDARRPSSQHLAKATAMVVGIEPTGLGRAVLERTEAQGARSERGLRLPLGALSLLVGLTLVAACGKGRCLGGHVSRMWRTGPVWVRGPPG